MMYKILDSGKVVNTIVADESFVRSYCEENNYTYEPKIQNEQTESVIPTPTIEERTAALEAAMLSMLGVTPNV